MKTTIRLFRAVPIKTKKKGKLDKKILSETIKNGFIFSKEIFGNYPKNELLSLVDLVKKEIGLSAKEMNNAFHKSWQKIKEADIEQLVVEQIAHYLTTYGKENPEEYLIEKEVEWGVDNLSEKVSDLKDFKVDKIDDKDYIYIPKEALKIPNIDIDKIRLIVIKGYTKEEIKEKLLALLQMGIALKEDTKKDVLDVALYVELNEGEIQTIKNKEVKTALYDYLGLIPQNPTEFLRYIIYKATEETLVIKNKALIEKIKEKQNLNIAGLLAKYKEKYGLEKLAEIFYRFKPLWLAFKTNSQSKKIINKIRKLAVKYHKPMPEDYLNTITAKIKKGESIEIKKLEEELSKINIFRKIRLAYALNFRTKDIRSILYKIRNNKGYATKFRFDNPLEAKTALRFVIDSIVKDISPQVKDKKIYIPNNIVYALPATEKQFTGNLPSGSYILIPKDMVFGVHWKNVKENRIDLDLSMVNIGGKYGWDADYRSEGGDILFSGDMTDAQEPNGATELFYIKRQIENSFIVMLNYYNYDSEVPVPFKILVAKEQVADFRMNYMVNPNNILATTEAKIDQKQKVLGLATITGNECRFYFSEIYLGRSITSSNSEFTKHAREYLLGFYKNTITLNEMLEKAGAIMTDKTVKCDINLSPETLEKDSIIKLLKKI